MFALELMSCTKAEVKYPLVNLVCSLRFFGQFFLVILSCLLVDLFHISSAFLLGRQGDKEGPLFVVDTNVNIVVSLGLLSFRVNGFNSGCPKMVMQAADVAIKKGMENLNRRLARSALRQNIPQPHVLLCLITNDRDLALELQKYEVRT